MKKLLLAVSAFFAVMLLSGNAYAATTTQWNLDRIDQRSNTLNGQYTPNASGLGVHVYVLDTGVRISNTYFAGKAVNGWDFVDNDSVANDCNGHGTNVAGIVDASTFGVAYRATVVAVRVSQCNGSVNSTTLINGMNWVRTHAIKPAVVNMSIGFVPARTDIDSATNALISAGITVVVSAGNSSTDACGQSPARVAGAITVAATNSANQFWTGSNRGSCVDILAPGVSIKATGASSDTATSTYTGTSQASPHVAAAAAQYLQGHPTATPAQVDTYLKSRATVGAISGVPSGTPNRFLYVGA